MSDQQQIARPEKRRQPKERGPRIYAPHREFLSGKEFVDWLKEAEFVRIYSAGSGW